jgi:hypothetical protein
MMRTIERRSVSVAAAWIAVACAATAVAAPRAWADSCDAALHTIDSSSVPSLNCRALHNLDDSLRVCTAGTAGRSGDRLEQARYEVSVALRRCTCESAPTAAALTQRLASSRTAFDLAQLLSSAEQARACTSTDAQRKELEVLDGKIQQVKGAKAYCRSAAADVGRLAQLKTGTCYEVQLRRRAAGLSAACGSDTVPDATAHALEALEAQVCAVPTGPAPPTCDATQQLADRLRQSEDPSAERQLWNLVATRLIAGASPRATRDERECANRMITTAVSDSAIADRNDRTTAESVSRDPQLRKRFADALAKSLKESGDEGELVKMLEGGADLKQVLAKASQLDDEHRRRFFTVAGGLGRALEAARAVSAFEQSSRGFDIVIAPKPATCKYADFENVLLAGIHKAAPAQISIVERNDATQTTTGLLEARTRSCGNAAPGAASGPGCGAVAEVQIEDRPDGRGGGQVRLDFVAPDGKGGSVTRETQTIRIPDFRFGCGSDAEESAAALRLVFDLQFAFATNPRESAVVLDRPVRTEVCGLRALPPNELPARPYDGKGLQIRGQELDAHLAGPSDGAREALQAWKYSVGEIDPQSASANLRFSSSPYTDPSGSKGAKLEADLTLSGQVAASFATVVLDGDTGCRAPLAERMVQAGRMIGNEAGSFLAYQSRRAQSAWQPPEAQQQAGPRRRWLVGAALGELLLVGGGVVLLDTSVSQDGTLVGQLSPDQRKSLGQGMLVTAGVGAALIAIIVASTR